MVGSRALATIVGLGAVVSGCGSEAAPPGPTAQVGPSSHVARAEPVVPWSDRVDAERYRPPGPQGRYGYPAEPPGRWPEVRPELVLPQAVSAGETVDYVVVLHNRSRHGVDLRPCGGYQQEVWVVADFTAQPAPGGRSVYRLNCDDAPLLGPGQSRRYAMRLEVPATVTGEEVMVRWGFIDELPDDGAQQWVTLR